MEEPDARSEDLVEAALSEVDVLEVADEELRLACFDVGRVPARRRFDHLRRAVDGRQAASVEALADERRRDAVATADLEDAVVRLDVKPLDDRLESLGHASSWRGR